MARDPRPAAYRDIADASEILVVSETTSKGKGLTTRTAQSDPSSPHTSHGTYLRCSSSCLATRRTLRWRTCSSVQAALMLRYTTRPSQPQTMTRTLGEKPCVGLRVNTHTHTLTRVQTPLTHHTRCALPQAPHCPRPLRRLAALAGSITGGTATAVRHNRRRTYT